MTLPVEAKITLSKFVPRWYQAPILDAIENKGYLKVVAILPRRAGKDVACWNLTIRQALRRVGVYWYILPTYSQAKKVIWNGMLSEDGMRFLDFIPKCLIKAENSQEMRITLINGSMIQLIGSDNVDCYDDKTEVLTQDGWRLFKDLSPNDKVATLCEGQLIYEIPSKHMSYDYDGEMYSISNHSMDFLVTPNHRFWVKSAKGVSKFKAISDPTIKHDMIQATSVWNGEHVAYIEGFKSEEFVALLGIFLSEGSTFHDSKNYRVVISQKKQRVCEDIRDLLNSMGIHHRYEEKSSNFIINSKALYIYFSKFGLQRERYIPRDILKLNKHLLHILFEWLMLGDGYRGKDAIIYYSVSKKLIDDVQEIILKLGYSANIEIKEQRPSYIRDRLITPKKTLYQVRVRTSAFKRLHGSNGMNYINKSHYQGKVYCVSVSSGVIKVRRNGKEMWCGNSLVGSNPVGCVFSEYALQDLRAYQYIRPILTANGGWAVFISTVRGRNHLWELYNIAKDSPDWYCYRLTIDDTQHIPMAEIDKERADGIMSEDLIQQEYYNSFDRGVEGAFYGKYIDRMKTNNQIGSVPWESAYKVHTAWDIGVDDKTVIIFYQSIGVTVRVIDYYEGSQEGLEHYVKIMDSKPYTWGKHFFPHDVAVREWGSGMTRLEKLKQLGIKGEAVPPYEVIDGIESVRSALSKFYIDDRKCALLIRALENYRKEWDSRRGEFKDRPLHDKWSHAADAMRYLCVSLPKTRDGLSPEDLERRYMQALYGDNSSMPAIFRDDLPPY